jgi:WhiB family redox-sensing transcriptional regulator
MYTDGDVKLIDLPELQWQDPDPSWRLDAACREHPDDTGDFFHGRRAVAQREYFCAHCPVTEQCWTYAVNNGVWYGSWGGRTQDELQEAVRNG